MEHPAPRTLRDFVLEHAARRGWRTQRQIAVALGLEESSLSRFLNGEYDLGARRTHELFQAVGVPVEQYDLAYRLVGEAQERAHESRLARLRRALHRSPLPRAGSGEGAAPFALPGAAPRPGILRTRHPARLPRVALLTPAAHHSAAYVGAPGEDPPVSVIARLFAEEGLTGAQIAAFFADGLAG